MNKQFFLPALLSITISTVTLSVPASATSYLGYICNVLYYPASAVSSYGDFGSIEVITENASRCNGTGASKTVRFCSIGATSNGCTSNANWLYTEADIKMLFEQTRSHMTSQRSVSISAENDCGWIPYAYCGFNIRFWANSPSL